MGIIFLKDVPGASSIVITDTTTQDELNVHMVTLGVTYKTVAYFLMVGVVMHNKLNMGTANKELSLISYEQAHVFWFFVKEVLVDFSEKGKFTFKGVETERAAAGGGPVESNAAIVKANAQARMETLEEKLSNAADISEAYQSYFFVA